MLKCLYCPLSCIGSIVVRFYDLDGYFLTGNIFLHSFGAFVVHHIECGVITAGSGTACVVGMVALGFSPRFRPATDDDLASVSQVVS